MVKQIREDATVQCMNIAIIEAKKSTCFRSKCGAVIINRGLILGKGFNSPPQNHTIEKCFKDTLPSNFKSDKTCCMHAEQRAILDAINRHGLREIKGSRLYFIRLNLGNDTIPSGLPYCTICSKMALDVGIAEWCLLHDSKVYGVEGYYVYDALEYHDLSLKYRE